MSYNEKILRGIKLHKDGTLTGVPESMDDHSDELMRNPHYLRQSSALINDALQKGLDVLQLSNGDIVTTGTKIVVTQYAWDTDKGKLVKAKSSTSGRRGRPRKADVEARKRQMEEA